MGPAYPLRERESACRAKNISCASILYHRMPRLQHRKLGSFALLENVIRVMDLDKEAPNVVTEPRFRDLVASGYRVEVVCKEDAFKKGPN